MFCRKCGAEIADGVNFCPKCGTPLQAVGNQPQPAPAQSAQPTPAQPAAPKNKLELARSLATPTQKKANITYLCILVVNLILAALWMCNTFAIYDSYEAMPMSIWYLCDDGYGFTTALVMLVATFAAAIMCPVVSKLFLTWHMLKQDRKANGSILSWLYLIWIAGFFAYAYLAGFAVVELGEDPEIHFGLTAPGWVYIALCVILLGLLVFLTALHFKAAKEHKALENS